MDVAALLEAWNVEPEPVDEATFTPDAPPGQWHAWNEWSPEVEVADMLPRLAETIKAQVVVETGVGQGFATRRLMDGPWDYIGYESDDALRAALQQDGHGAWLANVPSPSPATIADADLFICDSDTKVRSAEILAWYQHGKIGSYCFIHDANPNRPQQTGYWQLWKLADMSGLPMWQFGNPRGSVLLHKTHTPNLPNVTAAQPSAPTGKGSVMIAQLDGGEVDGAYAHSMARLMSYSMQWPGLVGGYVRQHSGPRVWHSRDQIVRHFLGATNCDWLLTIDSDMVFRWDLLEKMMASAEPSTRPIIAGHCYMLRGESGPLPTMWTRDAAGRLIHFEGYPESGLVPVEATGAAVMLTHRSVFLKLRDAFPDHPYPWYEETHLDGKPIGEDLTFCLRARSHGFPIYVDVGLDVGHNKTVTVDKAFFADWRKVRRTIVTGPPGKHLPAVANLLRIAGVACGNEWVYKEDGTVDWGTRWADASPYALRLLPGWKGPSIVVVQHPARLVAAADWPVEMSHWIWNTHDVAREVVRAEELSAADLARMLEVCRTPGVHHPHRLAELVADTIAATDWGPVDWDHPNITALPEPTREWLRRIAQEWGYSQV